jgi:HEAT repeat protein
MRTLPYLLVLAILAACGGPPPSAREARTLLDRGDYGGAERIADRELERVPGHPEYWRIKIQAALSAGDAARAVEVYESWRQHRGAHDEAALSAMAKTVLWQALRVPAAEVRVDAIQIIEQRELEVLAQDVIDLVAADDDRVAAAAAVAVVRIHPHAPRVLTDLLRSSDARARELAVTGIGRKVGEHARDDLVPMLDDPDPSVRRAAVRAVAGFGAGRDTERLVAIARDDADGTVRAAALLALARGDRGGTSEVAMAALDDDYTGARLAAVSLLARARGGGARPVLAELASSDDLLLALRAATELAALGEPRVDTLERALAAEAWTVRASAVNATARVAPRRTALTLLGGAIVDPRIDVRLAAARALLALEQTERAVRELLAALGAPTDDPRLQAAIDLTRIDHPAGVEALADLAASPSTGVRAGAIRAHHYADRPTTALVAALADDTIANRVTAADVLLELIERGP